MRRVGRVVGLAAVVLVIATGAAFGERHLATATSDPTGVAVAGGSDGAVAATVDELCHNLAAAETEARARRPQPDALTRMAVDIETARAWTREVRRFTSTVGDDSAYEQVVSAAQQVALGRREATNPATAAQGAQDLADGWSRLHELGASLGAGSCDGRLPADEEGLARDLVITYVMSQDPLEACQELVTPWFPSWQYYGVPDAGSACAADRIRWQQDPLQAPTLADVGEITGVDGLQAEVVVTAIHEDNGTRRAVPLASGLPAGPVRVRLDLVDGLWKVAQILPER